MDFALKLQEKTTKSYLSYTSIKTALDDMVKFELYVQGKWNKRSEALSFGSVYDCLLFTPEEFDKRFSVFDDRDVVESIDSKNPRATTIYKQWKSTFDEQSKDKEAVSLDDYQKAIDMITRIQETDCWEYLQGDYQKEVQGFIGDIPVRGFLDCLGNGFVSDSKTTRAIGSFKRDVFSFGYDIQAYIYMTLAQQKEYYWVAQDTSYPYTPALFKATEATINGGKYKFDRAVQIISKYLDGDLLTSTFSIYGEI
jgi:hypothetical protein